jgi:DNA-binding NtrC family response regulator
MKPERIEILVADADQSSASQCAEILKTKGYQVEAVLSPEAALAKCVGKTYHLLITEAVFPNRGSGSDFIRQIRDLHPQIGVILLTSQPTLDSAVNAMHQGVCDYLTKPAEEARLLEAVNRSLSRQGIYHTSDEAINKAVGTKIRDIRKKQGLTTQQLANRVGVTQSQISQVETGRSAGSVITLYKVAQAFNMNLSEILEGA